jgi:hypothetical protein
MTSNCTAELYVNNSNVVEWQSLTNSVTSTADTGASVTLTITDNAGAEITGETWPVTLSHVAAGTYRYTLADDIAITAGSRYTMTFNATGSGGEKGERIVVAVAERIGKTT